VAKLHVSWMMMKMMMIVMMVVVVMTMMSYLLCLKQGPKKPCLSVCQSFSTSITIFNTPMQFF
jgi:hypothetical protein